MPLIIERSRCLFGIEHSTEYQEEKGKKEEIHVNIQIQKEKAIPFDNDNFKETSRQRDLRKDCGLHQEDQRNHQHTFKSSKNEDYNEGEKLMVS
ncbi:hypothetical protein NPIL_333071 [Nephila pilipes]|uniref:Uncharacterized protein n=1 Tax=Nephila pilipes TaxID=299642 RepID=A0A8X6NJP3_NEPPI|nr:hypothetical protein NPIL_333071 [Nephila pilipes]